MTETALVTVTPMDVVKKEAWTADQVLGQIALIQEVMSKAMKDGEHFGTIPGCGPKPTLLKSGSEKLCLTFRLRPEYDINTTDLGGGHREHQIICNLYSIITSERIGQGIGSCSTMESKFRYRWLPSDPPEKQFQEEHKALGKGKFTKKYGKWVWLKKYDNPDIADVYNTVLKMGKKRALVDATIQATAASDIFTQDIEDMPKEILNPTDVINVTPDPEPPPPKKTAKKKPTPKKDPEPEPNPNEITKEQRGKIHAMLRDLGYTKEQMKVYYNGRKLGEKMTRAEASEVISELEEATKVKEAFSE